MVKTVLNLQILGVNMSVGIDGFIGKPLIREGRGLDVYVRRSLRDVFRKVTTFSLEVKVIFKLEMFCCSVTKSFLLFLFVKVL